MYILPADWQPINKISEQVNSYNIFKSADGWISLGVLVPQEQ